MRLWAVYIPDIRGAVGVYSTIEKAARAVADCYPDTTYEAILIAFTTNPGYRYFALQDVWLTAISLDDELFFPCND
jgi:hypothetical protein